MEWSRAELSSRLSVLYHLTEALEDAVDIEEMCEAAVDAVLEAANADRAAVLLLDDAGVPRFRAWRRLTPEYRSFVEGRSPWSRRDADPQAIRISDVLADPPLDELRPAFEAEGIRGLALLPVVRRGRLLGTFVLYRDRPGPWSEDDLDFAGHVARQAALAIERAGTAARLTEASERLTEHLRSERTLADAGRMESLGALADDFDDLLQSILSYTALLAGELAPGGRSPGAGGSRPTARVLLVDDEPTLRAVLGIALRRFGFEVTEADSAEAALGRVEEGPRVDVVVTDTFLTGMDGWELVERIRRALPQLPVVMISGSPPAGEVPEDLEYLQKPFSPDELADRVRALILRTER